jgi:hypothetical protein
VIDIGGCCFASGSPVMLALISFSRPVDLIRSPGPSAQPLGSGYFLLFPLSTDIAMWVGLLLFPKWMAVRLLGSPQHLVLSWAIDGCQIPNNSYFDLMTPVAEDHQDFKFL